MTAVKIKGSTWYYFHQALKFTDIYRKTTQAKVCKFELFNTYNGDDHAMMQIREMTHPDFIFTRNPAMQDAKIS